jgi:hypothetical protein
MASSVHIAPEFDTPTQCDAGVSMEIAVAFTELLEKVGNKLAPGREKSLLITKLQEAHFWAQIAPIYSAARHG